MKNNLLKVTIILCSLSALPGILLAYDTSFSEDYKSEESDAQPNSENVTMTFDGQKKDKNTKE